MTTFGKALTLLIIGAIFLAAITHGPGFSAVMMSSGNVLDNTLKTESGQGVGAGTKGIVTGGTVTVF